MTTEKAFIYYSRKVTAHNYMLYLIDNGIIPMISAERLENSRIYKQCDKWLLEHGFRREFVKVKTEDAFGLGLLLGNQDRYEYYKN